MQSAYQHGLILQEKDSHRKKMNLTVTRLLKPVDEHASHLRLLAQLPCQESNLDSNTSITVPRLKLKERCGLY